jgi:hypothetical protein
MLKRKSVHLCGAGLELTLKQGKVKKIILIVNNRDAAIKKFVLKSLLVFPKNTF